MNFGQILKKIRTDNEDSLRGLSEKTGIVFTYIDKIEKGITPINKTNLEKFIECYPLQKQLLLDAYLKEVLPDTSNTINIFKNDSVEDIYSLLIKKLPVDEKKKILNELITKVELESYKNGNLEKDKKNIEKIKMLIEKL